MLPGVQMLDLTLGPGHLIDQFASVRSRHLGGVRFSSGGGLAFLSVDPGGHIGRHPTVLAQLYCVVDGDGWVAGQDGARHAIAAGQAALWDPGEEHESGSENGMAVVVLEADSIQVR